MERTGGPSFRREHVRVVLRRIGHPGIHSTKDGTRPRSRTRFDLILDPVILSPRSAESDPIVPGRWRELRTPVPAPGGLDGGRPRAYSIGRHERASYPLHLPCRSWANEAHGDDASFGEAHRGSAVITSNSWSTCQRAGPVDRRP